jgi:septal ring factor EnvC (AmiA/AmiB activator)
MFNLKKSLKVGVLFLVMLLVTFSSIAQSKRELESKRKKLQKEIRQITRLLSKTQKDEENLLTQLVDINKKIEVRQELINTIEKESTVFSNEIKQNKKEITAIEKQLKTLKSEYAKMVVQTYKNKNEQSKFMFLLSSNSFYQAYKRLQYMKQYTAYREQQTIDIQKNKDVLIVLNDSLQIKKLAKDDLLANQKKEKESINSEKKSQQKLIDKAKKKEKKYLAQIKRKQKKERQFGDKLKNLIGNAIAKSNKKSNQKNTIKTKAFSLTPEAKKLEVSFVANKGKLPAPVENGYVSRYFGIRKHEIYKNLSVNSNGWFYTTAKNTKARAVFKGKILQIMVDKLTKIKAVIIQHGNYVTAYNNLENVLVKVGDKVDTKQYLGTIHTNKTTGKTVLAFILSKGKSPQNPYGWIYKI